MVHPQKKHKPFLNLCTRIHSVCLAADPSRHTNVDRARSGHHIVFGLSCGRLNSGASHCRTLGYWKRNHSSRSNDHSTKLFLDLLVAPVDFRFSSDTVEAKVLQLISLINAYLTYSYQKLISFVVKRY